MNDKQINLISQSFIYDEIGQQIATETINEAFCEVKSIRQAEFYQAGQNGLKADVLAIIWEFEYSNEKIVEIDNVRYDVYRTFVKSDERIELYLSKKVGV
jgi:SPP1 family predicted phage head-tail adaptor